VATVVIQEEELEALVARAVERGVGAALRAAQAPTGLLTARQAGQHLAMSEAAVRRAGQRGVLPFVKLPTGGVRYRVADLDNWIASGGVS
jgi:hypothetical protein